MQIDYTGQPSASEANEWFIATGFRLERECAIRIERGNPQDVPMLRTAFVAGQADSTTRVIYDTIESCVCKGKFFSRLHTLWVLAV